MRRSFIISLFVVLLSSALTAQTTALFTTYLIRDDNAFKTREAYDEWINNSALQIGHQFSGDNYRILGYYNADLYSYASASEFNSLGHKVGFSGARYVDDYTFNLTGYARLRNYNEPYVYYNLNRYSLHANTQYAPSLFDMYYAGLEINSDRYNEFNELDNLAYKIYGKYQHFFQNKISLTAYAGFGVKNYVNQSIIQYFGIGPFVRYREDPVKSTLFSTYVNVGKSLLPGLGLSVMLGGQWFLGDPVEVYSNNIYYYTENDLFDDPYSYQGAYLNIQLTKQFDIGFQAKAGVKFQNKNYTGIPALDENGALFGETRLDQRSEYFLFVTKSFSTNLKFPRSIDLFANFMFRQNPSNDPYYNYEDTIGLIGFSVGY
jgi:hypothetical protein